MGGILQALDLEDLDQGQRAAPWITAAAHTPEKQGAMDGQAQLSTSPRIRAKRFFKEKKEQKEVGKASTSNRSPIFRCASR